MFFCFRLFLPPLLRPSPAEGRTRDVKVRRGVARRPLVREARDVLGGHDVRPGAAAAADLVRILVIKE